MSTEQTPGRVAVITGASSGIGEATAARRSSHPFYRRDRVEVGMTAGQIILFGRCGVAGAHASLWVTQIPGVGDSARGG